MFPPLNIGDVISNGRLTEIFSCANMGGMRFTKTYKSLILISNHALKRDNPILNPYDDKWVDGIFYYTGEGTIGDQSLNRQNRRLYCQDYSACYLFEVFRVGECTYQGRVDLACSPKAMNSPNYSVLAPKYGEDYPNGIKGNQPDKNGKIRKVWVFPLVKLKIN